MSFHLYFMGSLFHLLFVYALIDKSELKEFVEDERLYKSTKRDLIFVFDMIENVDKVKVFIDAYFNENNPGFFSWLKNEAKNCFYKKAWEKVCDTFKTLKEMAKDAICNKKKKICLWSGVGFLASRAVCFVGFTNLVMCGGLACVTNTIYEKLFN